MYAQKDYPQKLGKSDNTIAEAGAFLTALANLLKRFDKEADPRTLNNFFLIKGMDAAQLTVGAISVYDPAIAVNTLGVGVPQFNDSIVKMKYHSKLTGEEAITYCLVADVTQGTIVDSFDGLVKSWNVYGGPVSFVTYAQYPPLVVTALKAPEKAPEPTPESIDVEIYTKAYSSSDDATARLEDTGIVKPGSYLVLQQVEDAILISSGEGDQKYWINTADLAEPIIETDNAKDEDADGIIDLHQDDDINLSQGIYEAPPAKKFEWQQTYTPGLGVIDAIAVMDVEVIDYTGENAPAELKTGQKTPIAGKFEIDGKVYFRTKTSVDNGHWYGIPREAVRRVVDIKDDEDEFDDHLNQIIRDEKAGAREKVIKAAATADGKVRGMFKIKR